MSLNLHSSKVEESDRLFFVSVVPEKLCPTSWTKEMVVENSYPPIKNKFLKNGQFSF